MGNNRLPRLRHHVHLSKDVETARKVGSRRGKPIVLQPAGISKAENDPAQGRGWAVVKDNELRGMIFFHEGDDSEFVTRKIQSKR